MTREQKLEEALRDVRTWADSQCPCHEETPNPCTLCGASVENLEACKSVESIFPRDLLRKLDAALSAPEEYAVGNMGAIFANLTARQEPLGIEFSNALSGDRSDLYATDSPKDNAEKESDTTIVPDLTAGEEAGGVKVKALEWKRYRDGDADAVTPFGDVYTAYAGGYWRITERGKAGKFIRAGFDTASAKAAAQADYERRILSALEPAPSPIVDDAMVERFARAWASIDGKLIEFEDERKSGNFLTEEDTGTFDGYMEEARELLKRAGLDAAALDAALSGAQEGVE